MINKIHHLNVMMKQNKQIFLYNTKQQLFFEKNTLSFFSCSYDINHFEDGLFSQFGVLANTRLSQAVKKRRAEYLAGRVCAIRALNKLAIADTNIISNTDRSPNWPDGIVGSITHTHNKAAAVVAFNKTIYCLGIDCENIMTSSLALDIKQQILSKDEKQENYQVSQNLNIFVTLIFSAKESFYKALYPHVKKMIGFHDVLVTKIDTQTVTLRLNIDFGNFRKGDEFDIHYIQNDNTILTLLYLDNDHFLLH